MRFALLLLLTLLFAPLFRLDAQSAAGTPTPSTLTVHSIPDSATVYVDSAWFGRTPLTFDLWGPRTLTVMVVRNGYETEARTLTIDGGRSETISFTLRSWTSVATFLSNSPSTLFRLRPKPRTVAPGDTAVLALGGVEVTAEDTLTGVKTTAFYLVNSREPMTFRSEMNYIAPWKILRGIAVPGLVQGEDEAFQRSGLMFSLAAGSTTIAALAFSYQLLKERDFDKAQEEYRKAGNENLAVSGHRKLAEKHDALTTAVRYRNIGVSIMGLVWAVNAADILWNHSRDARIERTMGTDGLSAQWNGDDGMLLTYRRDF